MRAVRVFAAFITGMLCAAGVAWSQAYPTKPVRVIANAMRDPGIASKLSALTYDPVHRAPEELAQRLRADYEKIGKLFRQFGVKLD